MKSTSLILYLQQKKEKIEAKVVYKTLEGRMYEFSQTMTQEARTDGLFNVSLTGVPRIIKISRD